MDPETYRALVFASNSFIYGGLALMTLMLWPFGEGRGEFFRYPIFLALGAVCSFIGLVLGVYAGLRSS